MRKLGLLAMALILALHAGQVQAQVEQETGSTEINFTPRGQTLRFQGEIIPRPDLTVTVRASMWGKIYLEEGVHEGAKVEKDQPLARTVLELPALERLPLDDRTLEIEQYLEVAKQRARLAMDDYQRAVEISKENPEFEAERDRRKQIYQDSLKALQIVNQQNTRQMGVIKRRDPRTVIIKSPLSGYIDEIYFVPGDINPDGEFRKLLTIIDLSTVWVQAEIYERDLPLFQNAPEALIATTAYPGETFRARFQSLGSEIDPETRTLPVYFEISNPEGKLKVGLRVTISPITDQS
ncbi:MAG: efflux RND transporter periplasmic adaptor subunit [Acidobacteria bacterium]|nr:efflux RND transporter periplasmic adaptor subunit [Acidobacteriota bacterium]